MIRTAGTLLAAALAAGSVAGCGAAAKRNAADKAGGTGAPVVLRVANPYDSAVADAEALRIITEQTARASHGTLRFQIVNNAAGQSVPGVEAKVAKLVQQGRFDLGWIGTRAWDQLGLRSFQALQAPFLITDYRLLDEVMTGPLVRRMLTSLDRKGLVGIVLVPDLLRHPMGVRRPLVSLADFRGASVRDIPSRVSDALIRSLGATPVHVANDDVPAAIANGRIDGQELAIVNGFDLIITGNVSFFPKVMTLFAGQRAFDRLTDEQKAVLLAAPKRLRQHIWAPSENGFIAKMCSGKAHGRVVLASKRQLAQLEDAARPVYAQLERDSETRALIAAIRRLKASMPAPPAIVAPASCAKAAEPAPVAGTPRAARLLNGTYRWVFTAAAARAFGPPASDSQNADYPAVNQAVLRDGKWIWMTGGPADRGTYTIRGNTVTFVAPAYRGRLSFTFTRTGDGTLTLKAVQPMERGDQWVWSGAPWRRVGPPIKTP